MSTPSTAPVADVLDQATQAVAWVKSMGVPPGRFDQLLDDLGQMERAFKTGEPGRLTEPLEHRATMIAVVESLDLIQIHRAFRGREEDELRRRLAKGATGPRSGSTETSEKHAGGRNVLAELSWAAALRMNGASTELDPRADVVSLLEGRGESSKPPAVVWEVKRPLSFSSLENIVVKAARQVRDIVATPHEKFDLLGGCVVVSLDHAPLPGLVDAHSTDVIGPAMEVAIKKFGWERMSTWLKAAKTGVVGVVLRWRPMARVPYAGNVLVPFGCEQVAFIPVRPERPPHAVAVAQTIMNLRGMTL